MRRTATSTAVAAFIILAIVGTVSGVPPFVCGMRALVGAGVVYVLVTVAWRVAISILVGIIRNSQSRELQTKDKAGEHTN